nr:hypothetical protein [Burkholderia metallica]
MLSVDTTHDRTPDFDTCPRRLVRGPIFGIEVISPGQLDSVFANPNVRHPGAAGRRLHGLDDDFVTVEFITMAFDSLAHRVPPSMRLMLLSRSALCAIVILKREAEMASRLIH